jgi:hypothetical protein
LAVGGDVRLVPNQGQSLNLQAPLGNPDLIPIPAQRLARTKIRGGLINEYDAAA